MSKKDGPFGYRKLDEQCKYWWTICKHCDKNSHCELHPEIKKMRSHKRCLECKSFTFNDNDDNTEVREDEGFGPL